MGAGFSVWENNLHGGVVCRSVSNSSVQELEHSLTSFEMDFILNGVNVCCVFGGLAASDMEFSMPTSCEGLTARASPNAEALPCQLPRSPPSLSYKDVGEAESRGLGPSLRTWTR